MWYDVVKSAFTVLSSSVSELLNAYVSVTATSTGVFQCFTNSPSCCKKEQSALATDDSTLGLDRRQYRWELPCTL